MSPRALIRAFLIALLTLVGQTLVFVSRPLRRVANGLQLRWRNLLFRRWGRAFLRLAGARVEITGEAPEGRFLLVVNHLSYLDIPLIAAAVDGAFVAKADLRGWPLLGWIFATLDTIFIDRGRRRDVVRVLRLVDRARQRGLGIVIFGEGGIGNCDEIRPLKPSLLELAAQRQEPVHYATLSYATPPGSPPAREAVCWLDGSPFGAHFLRMLRLPRFDAVLRFGPEPIVESDRKRLAQELRAAMQEQYTPPA